MTSPKSSVWADAPELAIPDLPVLLCDSDYLWLCYAVAPIAPTEQKRYAVVQFTDVIDHRLSPINDEGIEGHPYAKAGLKFYAFNEITNSAEAIEWAALRARHWTVTFKDNTLDVVAGGAKVVARDVQAKTPVSALIDFLRNRAH